MSLQGPLLVVSDDGSIPLVTALERAGAFPIVEARAIEAAGAVAAIEPAAIIVDDTISAGADALDEIVEATLRTDGPFIPILAMSEGPASRVPILPISAGQGFPKLIAMLRAVLRVRGVHASVLRKVEALQCEREEPQFPAGDPINDATVLVVGRGGGYPALSTAVGERVGLIGALSLETALSYLQSRDTDALIIGDGFNRGAVASFVEGLSLDPRFRDLPIGIVGSPPNDIVPERLPLLLPVGGDPGQIATAILPYARLHAFLSRLRRMIMALDAKGVVDPETGLYTHDAFVRDFTRAVTDAETRGVALALARFSLENLADIRTSKDAARLVGRLVRAGDFACRDRDGTILVAFNETDLPTANVVARRIASILKHTVLAPGCDRSGLVPTVTLAGLNTRDTAATLLSRVTAGRAVAAE